MAISPHIEMTAIKCVIKTFNDSCPIEINITTKVTHIIHCISEFYYDVFIASNNIGAAAVDVSISKS